MTARTRSLAAAGLALLVAGVLTACATPAGSGTTPSSAPSASGTGTGTETEVDAAWVDGGRMIALVTQGSSTCVPNAGDVSYADGVLQVEVVNPPEDTACTADLVPRATLVAVPEGVDPTQELEIRLTGDLTGDTDLDGVSGLAAGGETDYLPSAGWVDDGQFVVVTWGSSSCPPIVENAAATSASEVTVTFATPPADQVCTMDMAPRGTVVQVTDDSLDDDAEVYAILTGGGFDNVRVPIIGHD